jgi:hypothetical protein
MGPLYLDNATKSPCIVTNEHLHVTDTRLPPERYTVPCVDSMCHKEYSYNRFYMRGSGRLSQQPSLGIFEADGV